MCGRYTLFDTKELASRFNVANKYYGGPRYNVAPSQTMPVITMDRPRRRLELMQWGLVPSWAKDDKIGHKLINARSESVFERPVWRKVILRKRCLVPANGFYEWMREGAIEKKPYYIHPKDSSLFAFAGVWETWVDDSGKACSTFAILTTSPNKEMSTVHDRMPVILRHEDENWWLDPLVDHRSAIEPLLRSYADNELELLPVNKRVNSTEYDSDDLISPLNDR